MKTLCLCACLLLTVVIGSNIFSVEFGRDGYPIKNSGTCRVEQWGESLSYISQSIKEIGFNKYMVEIGQCSDDPYVELWINKESQPKHNDYCIEKVAQLKFSYKRHCMMYSLMRTCQVRIDD
jgi:hypothetical protein